MTTTPTSGAAIQRYKIGYHSDEWGQRSSTPSGIPDASGSWVRYADHVNALAAGQATAAQGFRDGVASVSAGSEPVASYAIRLLVAADFITQAKADEALRLAAEITVADGPADGESK